MPLDEGQGCYARYQDDGQNGEHVRCHKPVVAHGLCDECHARRVKYQEEAWKLLQAIRQKMGDRTPASPADAWWANAPAQQLSLDATWTLLLRLRAVGEALGIS